MRVAIAALVSIALFVALALHASIARAQLLSPGALSKAHASVEGDTRCGDCHTSGKRIDAQSCLVKCHGDLAARINQGLGLHGREYRGKPCEGCHVEHLGREGRLVRWPGGDPKKLDHALTGWALQNAHKTAACERCHDKRNVRGAPTYLGVSNACASCHKDPHAGRFGATCTSCHDDASWRPKLDGFNHDLARYPLRGAHQKVACAGCHQEPPKYTGLDFGSCASCHADPHGGKLGGACSKCHNEEAWRKVKFATGAHPGLSIGGGHAGVSCRACHDRGTQAAPSKGRECASCHKPVHEAPFGRGCASCHGNIKWLGLERSVGLEAHGRTPFPLTGEHGNASCTSCHKPELPANVRYRRLEFDECKDCHKDAHAGEFNARSGGECGGCHDTKGFRPALFGVAKHADTRFPLTGLHSVVACGGCHTAPRPRVDFRSSKQSCVDCHDNPHGNQFATEMARAGCASCHQPSGWHNPKIDHSTWPLTGGHAATNCDSCHKPSPQDRAQGKGASYRGVPRACGGCHDDVHAGQFRTKAPVYECDRCHGTQSFKVGGFDHAGIARYALTGSHSKVQCTGCHATVALADGSKTTRWRLPSNECKYCHANPHDRSGK